MKVRKKYIYTPKFKFDKVAILKDFETLGDFQKKYGISRLTYLRGISKKNKWGVPTKYLINLEKMKSRVWCGEGIIFAKTKEEATHFLEVESDGRIVLRG